MPQAGKPSESSVLEALSGVALSRGEKMITRCPIILSLRSLKRGETAHETIRSESTLHESFDDLAEVPKRISDLTDFLAGLF